MRGTAAQQAFLGANSQLFAADLLTLTPVAALSLPAVSLTSWDADLLVGGVTYSSIGAGLGRSKARWTSGLETATLDLKLTVDTGITLGGVPLAAAAASGALDYASVLLQRLFSSAPGDTSQGAIWWFQGMVSEIQIRGTELSVRCKSPLESLQLPLPHRLFEPVCPFGFLDASCDPGGTIRTAATTINGVSPVVAPTASAVAIPGNYAAGFFANGTLSFTSGANVGTTRTIASDVDSGAAHVLTLAVPFPVAPAVNDAFKAVRGCDKTTGQSGCALWGNLTRYGGFPYVPRPENLR